MLRDFLPEFLSNVGGRCKVSVKKLRLALIGKDVSKSDSHKIHDFILRQFGCDLEYETISLSPSQLDDTMRYLLGDFDGFNVTIPYKRDVMEYLDEIVGDAATFGAVNTVVCATRKGYNTDGWGFLQMLKLHGVSVEGKKALILGAGGAGRSTAVVLKKAGATVYLYQRRKQELEETCQELGVFAAEDPEVGGYDIIINATGVGMHDTVGKSPVSAAAFKDCQAAVDLIYKPTVSEFLRLAAECGLQTVSGGGMLFLQGYYADCYFLGQQADEQEGFALYKKYLESEENI